MRVCSHFSQLATWPPSAAVRQRSIADITLSWPRLRWPAWARRQAGPWAQKISATSRAARCKRTAASRRRRDRHGEAFERTGDVADGFGGDLGVERRGVELLVAEQHLDHTDVDLRLDQMFGEAGPQRLPRDALFDAGRRRGGLVGTVELSCRERLAGILPRTQLALWPG